MVKAEPRKSLDRDDIGLAEVVTFEQQRLTTDLGEGVGETIPVVQAGGVPTSAISPVGHSGRLGLIGIDRDKIYRCSVQPQFQFTASGFAEATLSITTAVYGYDAADIIRTGSFSQR